MALNRRQQRKAKQQYEANKASMEAQNAQEQTAVQSQHEAQAVSTTKPRSFGLADAFPEKEIQYSGANGAAHGPAPATIANTASAPVNYASANGAAQGDPGRQPNPVLTSPAGSASPDGSIVPVAVTTSPAAVVQPVQSAGSQAPASAPAAGSGQQLGIRTPDQDIASAAGKVAGPKQEVVADQLTPEERGYETDGETKPSDYAESSDPEADFMSAHSAKMDKINEEEESANEEEIKKARKERFWKWLGNVAIGAGEIAAHAATKTSNPNGSVAAKYLDKLTPLEQRMKQIRDENRARFDKRREQVKQEYRNAIEKAKLDLQQQNAEDKRELDMMRMKYNNDKLDLDREKLERDMKDLQSKIAEREKRMQKMDWDMANPKQTRATGQLTEAQRLKQETNRKFASIPDSYVDDWRHSKKGKRKGGLTDADRASIVQQYEKDHGRIK